MEVGAKVAVVGAGYVGLTTAIALASMGHQVCCADSDPSKVEQLRAGEPTILEAGMPEALGVQLASGRLHFELGAVGAVLGQEFVFLCLPTPKGRGGQADVSAVRSVAREISPHLEAGCVVVNKSTVPVGCSHSLREWLGRDDVPVVSNPEFLREGTALSDCLRPERVVVGAVDRMAGERVARLFDVDAPVLITDPVSAELTKYASNAFLATKMSFVNGLAGLCDQLDANVDDVLRGMSYDHRIGGDYMHPGPGWGGSCLPKDTSALLAMAGELQVEFSTLSGAVADNRRQQRLVVEKVRAACGGQLDGRLVAVWGLTFKAGTDDLRESPALGVVEELLSRGATVHAHDPAVPEGRPGIDSRAKIGPDPYRVCERADVLVVLTEWEAFRTADLGRVRGLLRAPELVDARNLYQPEEVRRLGFHYRGIGRG